MSNLTILNSSVRTFNNLYSLNDLHCLSGSEAKHQPNRFMRLDTTQELINEIMNSTSGVQNTNLVFKTLRGRGIQGTYACEELALAYATWISPKFHLVVLRAFIAMHKGEVQNTQPKLPLAEPQQDEETLNIIINLFHLLNDAYEMNEILNKNAPTLANTINKTIGGNYLYNLHHPTEQALTNAKRYIQAKRERVMFVKSMLNLLDQPTHC